MEQEARPPPERTRVLWSIEGIVQGVGYRERVRRAARQIGVSGHVQNLPDGTVRVVAEGTLAQLAELERRILGSQGASDARRLTRVARTEPTRDPTPFEVRL
jgi:acylphosphatase